MMINYCLDIKAGWELLETLSSYSPQNNQLLVSQRMPFDEHFLLNRLETKRLLWFYTWPLGESFRQ